MGSLAVMPWSSTEALQMRLGAAEQKTPPPDDIYRPVARPTERSGFQTLILKCEIVFAPVGADVLRPAEPAKAKRSDRDGV